MVFSDIVIVGGGLAGLVAAYECKKRNPNFSITIIEKERIGGQLYSTESNGTWFDIGGHFFHNINLLPDDYSDFQKQCEFFKKNTYSVDVFGKVYHGMIQNYFPESTLKRDSSTLHEHLRTSFGDDVFNRFLLPYNSKLHKLPLSQCYVPEMTKRQTPAKGSVSYNDCFLYPSAGGAMSFIDFLLKKIKDDIRFVFDEAIDYNLEKHLVLCKSGRTISYKYALFNTGSIVKYLGYNSDSPTVYVTNGYARLNSDFVHLDDPCWCYLASPKTNVFRIGNYRICGGKNSDGMFPFYMESCQPLDKNDVNYVFSDVCIHSEYTVYNAYPLDRMNADKIKRDTINKHAEQRFFWIGRYGKDQWFSMSDTILDTIEIINNINWGN